MNPERRLQELHLILPPPAKPVGVYKPAVLVGNMMYLSGHGPLRPDGTIIQGRVGENLTLEEGKNAARQTGLALLATMRQVLGSLDRVKRLIKSLGLVQCTPEFKDQPKVINGYSELMAEVFGTENGIGARSAIGAVALPGGMAVEIECIWEVET